MCFNPISTTKSRLDQFGTTLLARIFIGYARNSGRCWTGDLIIADWRDTENNVASKVHVKRFNSTEVEIKK